MSESSGITWNSHTESYFAVGDEGFVYELDRDLNILKSHKIGSFDLEAITIDCVNNRIYCLDESQLSLIELDADELTILNIYPIRLEKEKKRNYSQFESLAYNNQTFYIAASTTEKNKKYGTLFSVTLDNSTMVPIADIPLWDISGMSFTDDIFYFISDEKDIIARYFLGDSTINAHDLPGDHQEGIILTDQDNLLIIDEDSSFRLKSLRDFNISE